MVDPSNLKKNTRCFNFLMVVWKMHDVFEELNKPFTIIFYFHITI